MSVSLGANGNSYSYPEANDTGWASDGTNWASAVSAALTSIGLGASLNSKAVIDLVSTTKGFLMPRMTTTQRDAIASPPAGLEIYNTTTNKVNIYNGSSWVSDIADGDTFTGNVVGNILQNILHVQDQKPAGTDGGTFTSGAWRSRTLNTVLTNTITGASVGSNQITLPAGTYFADITAISNSVDANKLVLFNTTDSTDTLVSIAGYNSVASVHNVPVTIRGRFTIASQKVFEVNHQCQTTKTTDGFGKANTGFSVIGVFCDVLITRLD